MVAIFIIEACWLMDRVKQLMTKTYESNGPTYITQVLVISIVIFTCLFNLTAYPGKADKAVWISLLTGCLGFILPHPQYIPLNIKGENGNRSTNTLEEWNLTDSSLLYAPTSTARTTFQQRQYRNKHNRKLCNNFS